MDPETADRGYLYSDSSAYISVLLSPVQPEHRPEPGWTEWNRAWSQDPNWAKMSRAELVRPNRALSPAAPGGKRVNVHMFHLTISTLFTPCFWSENVFFFTSSSIARPGIGLLLRMQSHKSQLDKRGKINHGAFIFGLGHSMAPRPKTWGPIHLSVQVRERWLRPTSLWTCETKLVITNTRAWNGMNETDDRPAYRELTAANHWFLQVFFSCFNSCFN